MTGSHPLHGDSEAAVNNVPERPDPADTDAQRAADGAGPAEASPPWGYKLTFVAYIEGDEPLAQARLDQTVRAVADEMPWAHFLGVSAEPVQDEPKDQVAT